MLIYYDEESPRESRYELDGIPTSYEVLTHASFCEFEKGKRCL